LISALDIKPDRIIVGEVQGAEALYMRQAMNTGHDGSLTTVHADNPRDALTRIETMCMLANAYLPEMAIRQQIASAVHVIVQVALAPFSRQPALGHPLSPLAAMVIQSPLSASVCELAILHTFNGQLAFNSHVHTMITGGGLYGSNDTWISRIYYDRALLMQASRRAVIAFLRPALRADQLGTPMAIEQMEEMLTQQVDRW